MTGKERMLTAFARREPDAVPVWEMAFNEESIIKLGRFYTDDLPPMKFAQQMTMEEKVKLLNTLFTVARELELDGLTSIGLLGTEPVDDEHVKDGWGRILRVSEEGEATAVGGPVSDPADLKGLQVYHPQPTDFLMLMASVGNLGTDVAQVMVQPGPFRESWSLLGSMEKLLYHFIKNPAFVKDLAQVATDYILEVIDMAYDNGADIVALDGDLAFNQTTLMSPAHYEEYVFPYHQQIAEHAHRRNKLIFKHSDGNMWPIMDGIADAGFDGFHPVQPQCMDIGEVKRKYGNRLCILGNIDCTYLLPFGSEEEVVDVGEDVKTEKFVQAYREHRPDILGLSALLSSTMQRIPEVIEAVRAEDSGAVIMVGGAPLTQDFADRSGADGYAPNAFEAAKRVRELLG